MLGRIRSKSVAETGVMRNDRRNRTTIENLNAPLPLDLVRDGKDKRVVISGD